MTWKITPLKTTSPRAFVAQPTGAEAGVNDPSRHRYEQNDCGERAGTKTSSRDERHDVEEKVDKDHAKIARPTSGWRRLSNAAIGAAAQNIGTLTDKKYAKGIGQSGYGGKFITEQISAGNCVIRPNTSMPARPGSEHRSCCCNRQLAPGGLRFLSTSASVIIIIIGSTGHS